MSDLEAVDLERGAELLDECGWIQRGLGSRTEGFCGIAAVHEAIRERTGQVIQVGGFVSKLLGLNELETLVPHFVKTASGGFVTTQHSRGLPAFNDTPGRTKEEVQDLLMLGAKKLREQGR